MSQDTFRDVRGKPERLRDSPLSGDPIEPLPEEYVESFVASMPSHYRGYEAATIRAHAAVAHGRRGPVHIGIWRRLPGGGVAICVVAPDRPGLLSLIATSFTLHDLDVIAAQVFTRNLPTGEAEAVDLFWLRRRPLAKSQRELTSEEIVSVKSLLGDLLTGHALASTLLARSIVDTPPSVRGMTSVRFEPDQDGRAVLVVEAYDRPGLLLTISRALFCLDLQVVSSDVQTSQGRVLDRFYLVDFDGRTIPEPRRARIEEEVLGAVEKLR